MVIDVFKVSHAEISSAESVRLVRLQFRQLFAGTFVERILSRPHGSQVFSLMHVEIHGEIVGIVRKSYGFFRCWSGAGRMETEGLWIWSQRFRRGLWRLWRLLQCMYILYNIICIRIYMIYGMIWIDFYCTSTHSGMRVYGMCMAMVHYTKIFHYRGTAFNSILWALPSWGWGIQWGRSPRRRAGFEDNSCNVQRLVPVVIFDWYLSTPPFFSAHNPWHCNCYARKGHVYQQAIRVEDERTQTTTSRMCKA